MKLEIACDSEALGFLSLINTGCVLCRTVVNSVNVSHDLYSPKTDNKSICVSQFTSTTVQYQKGKMTEQIQNPRSCDFTLMV